MLGIGTRLIGCLAGYEDLSKALKDCLNSVNEKCVVEVMKCSNGNYAIPLVYIC